MKKLVFTVFLSFSFIFLFGQTEKTIVGYYPNWQWYDRANLVNPETIQYEKYTIINYAFFNPLADGSIQSTDAWADENLLLGPMIWWPDPHHDSTKSLPYLAHQAGVKVLPSIGGWTLSYNFPGIAADPVKRQNFAASCIELINTHNFDGVDMDWEYPGYEPNGGTTADKQNFTLLLQEIRDALNVLEISTGKEYLLTSCFGAAQERMESIEWENVVPLVDMVNLMTYDFHGSWDTLSNFHTPLYSPEVGNPDWCFDGTYTKLTQEYNVPAEKINIGIAFYGKALANCTQLYGTHTGYDGATFWEDEGQPLYYNILNKMDQFTYYWDDQVKCPYLLGNNINTFVTYDNPQSVAYKANYVIDNNAKGVIIWEITGDYLETSPGSGQIEGTPLLDTIHAVFDDIVFLPVPTNLSGPPEVEINTSIELSWDAPENKDLVGYNIYRSIDEGGYELIGNIEISEFIDDNIEELGVYEYYVTAVWDEGESNASNIHAVDVFEVVGIHNTIADNILVYPNPASDFIFILAQQDILRLEVFNQDGRLVFEKTGNFQNQKLNVSEFSTGAYLINITSSGKTVSKRIIIR